MWREYYFETDSNPTTSRWDVGLISKRAVSRQRTPSFSFFFLFVYIIRVVFNQPKRRNTVLLVAVTLNIIRSYSKRSSNINIIRFGNKRYRVNNNWTVGIVCSYILKNRNDKWISIFDRIFIIIGHLNGFVYNYTFSEYRDEARKSIGPTSKSLFGIYQYEYYIIVIPKCNI